MNTTSKLVDELILRNDIHIIDEYVSTELEITEIYERILKKEIIKPFYLRIMEQISFANQCLRLGRENEFNFRHPIFGRNW